MNYRVKYPTRTKAVLGASLLFSFGMLQVTAMTGRTFPLLFMMQMAVLAIVLVSLAVEVYAMRSRRTVEISSASDTITVNGRMIHCSEIQAIKLKGINCPAIGIQLKSKHIIPMNCCFAFAQEAQSGIEELMKWAKRNEVPVNHTYFMTWF
ncbi:6-phosphogluconate dehydrogenase [Paenibacillus alvei]|uniref:6-phosphogluconate dehydrogenase n=1 Tax=Paenibacillus alvei TaxID=44250 RepID=UPI0018CEF1D9|nr:6-phosphogluconate dehydrogenase [Paenibacillus alvei]MBG9735586.1 6-phosphogluconate dehydrogenase [Paenibacillus alvei]MBG9746684.1 6-phosphogluconate dehydrogenase [Paenibacillus alvei]MCY9578461.1 6-phosphogluconate dehydrogenase [Paenibacillus alvei]MCY9584782.1 6-phosphogluconate dehydrogenase [Paenibacillus alvei]